MNILTNIRFTIIKIQNRQPIIICCFQWCVLNKFYKISTIFANFKTAYDYFTVVCEVVIISQPKLLLFYQKILPF